MKTTILSLSLLTITFFFVNTNSFAQKKEKDKILVNRIYTVDFTETSSKKPGKPVSDEISFKSDKLNSKFMTTEHKFPAAAYTVSVDSSVSPKTITFQSESKSPDGETLKYDGTITDDAIEGTAEVTSKKGKTTHSYTFSGSQKVKPGKK